MRFVIAASRLSPSGVELRQMEERVGGNEL